MDIFTKTTKYLLCKVKFRKQCNFGFQADISTESIFEGFNKIASGSYFKGYLGLHSYISTNATILARVGRFTSIGPKCEVIYGTHPYKKPFVSTSPYFIEGTEFEEFKYADKENKYPVVIGNDCWICNGASIISGITINDGAVIMARSVVTKDIPPYAIVGGIPAKIIGYRYSQETIEWLRNLKWWEKDLDWINKNKASFTNLDILKKMAI
ncbi:CatB-related O-acetyltransferase [Marinifilum sp. RC60d5]|uniref:CatB-related O-acetyltransferase n=1 Tax=Marinifilum sp. RC60d5 TaxID=3458414 RepID=UPI0040352DEE